MESVHAVGRRKTAIARVYFMKGNGVIKVNQREFMNYFPLEAMRLIVKQPIEKLKLENHYDVTINVSGGGLRGQAEAVRLGIARACCKLDMENNKPLLKKEGFLTRDARIVERKKYGRKKARKRFQFTKR
ncbi:30S ribosomal protein S9 [Candidatus Cardinium hertigii]|nr:30S ribosomal protein S9 [Candidatus Cardinium hertigii]